MLVATYVTKRDTADQPVRHTLQIERSTAAAVDIYMVSPGTNETYRPVGNEDFIFVHAGTDEDLIGFTGIY